MALLYVTYPTGYVHVLSFPTEFERALHMILLAAQPVTLRIARAA
jgi:hypothetical protein